MTVYSAISSLIKYAHENELITLEDEVFTINRICNVLKIDTYVPEQSKDASLEEILKTLLDYAVEKEIIEDSIAYRDLFDTRIMDCLLPTSFKK